MTHICRTCDKKARDTSLTSYVISSDKLASLMPSAALSEERKALRKTKAWDAKAYEAWMRKYLADISHNEEARKALNTIHKATKKSEDLVVVVSENERWDTSLRRILTGLLLGAGVKSDDISVGNELKSEEIPQLTGIYQAYRSLKLA